MALGSLLLGACIKNDIPYPTIKLQILSIEVKDQEGRAIINNDERKVIVTLSDEANPATTEIRNISVTEGAKTELASGMVIDLNTPYTTTLSLYQDYEWTIEGVHNIEYLFSVENQVGESEFDPVGCKVVAYVTPETTLRRINVLSAKLGPKGSVMNPVLVEGEQDFRDPVEVSVTKFGKTTKWKIYVEQKTELVTTREPDAWAKVAWLYGDGITSDNRGFEYRRMGSPEWTKVAEEYMQYTASSFSARLPHLEPLTEYVYRAFIDDNYGEEIRFMTSSEIKLPDASFDEWHLGASSTGKLNVWNPWSDTGSSFWDTGNKGASIVRSNSVPTDDIWPGKDSGQAACLESYNAILKFAAGNLFTGKFMAIDGTNGILNFGRPFDSYPTRLNGYYKYDMATINYASGELSYMKGRPDTAAIYIALTDWAAPLEVRTNPNNRQLFDKNDPSVIAYAELNVAETITDYQPFSLELEYRATNRRPTHILVVASASKYGDYFTGGAGSTLYVDEFSLEYDY